MDDEMLGLDAWIESIEREIWERSHTAATMEGKAEMNTYIIRNLARGRDIGTVEATSGTSALAIAVRKYSIAPEFLSARDVAEETN